MRSFAYAAAVARDGDDFVVSVRDLPQVVTASDTEVQAWKLAADAIEVVVAAMLERALDIPEPSAPVQGERLIALPSCLAAKVSDYTAWRKSGMHKALSLWEQAGEDCNLECTHLKRAYDEGMASGPGREIEVGALFKSIKAKAGDVA